MEADGTSGEGGEIQRTVMRSVQLLIRTELDTIQVLSGTCSMKSQEQVARPIQVQVIGPYCRAQVQGEKVTFVSMD